MDYGVPQPRWILLAEDEEAVRNFVIRILNQNRYVVTDAKDGTEALDTYDFYGPFDAVITDLEMPRMDGIELAKQLLKRNPHLPIVVLSGYVVQANVPEGLVWLLKPVAPGQLIAVLKRLLPVSGTRLAWHG